MRIRVKYSKQGLMKFIGHLDMMRYFQKACRRAGIDVTYTEGMSPHMSMSYAFPLGVGMTSDSEYVDVDISTPLSGEEITERLNQSAPEGIHFLEAREIGITKAEKGMNQVARADYTLRFREGYEWEEGWEDDFEEFLKKDEILVIKKGKKTEKEVNIRPLIYKAEIEKTEEKKAECSDAAQPGSGPAGRGFREGRFTTKVQIHLGLAAGNENNIRPELVMQAYAEAAGRTYTEFMFHINRDEVYADQGEEGAHAFVPLIHASQNDIP